MMQRCLRSIRLFINARTSPSILPRCRTPCRTSNPSGPHRCTTRRRRPRGVSPTVLALGRQSSVLTDGIDTSSSLTASEVSGLASSIDVPVFIVATVPSLDQRLMIESTDRRGSSGAVDLRDLAEWTGGRLIFARTFVEATTVAASLVTELRQQYVLAIEAASAREWRRLEVRVKQPRAVVMARSGYFGG